MSAVEQTAKVQPVFPSKWYPSYPQAIVVIALLTVFFQNAPSQVTDPLEQIIQALKSAKYSEALVQARSLAAVNPLDAEAQALLGLALLGWGEIEEAKEALDFSLSLDPGCAEAHLGIGRLTAGFGQQENAVEHLVVALESRRFRGEAIVALSRVYFEQGIPDSAFKIAELITSDADLLPAGEMQRLRSDMNYYRALGSATLLNVNKEFQKTTIDLERLAPEGKDIVFLGISVRLDGADVGALILDTAFPGYLVLSERVAERLGLEHLGSSPLPGGDQNEFAAHRTVIEKLEMGGLKVGRVPALIAPTETLGSEITGVAGFGLLKHFSWTLDIRNSTLELFRGDRSDLLRRNVDASRVASRALVFQETLPLVEAGANGGAPAPFLLATASSATMVDSTYPAENSEIPLDGSPGIVSISAYGFSLHAYKHVPANFNIGETSISNLETHISDLTTVAHLARQRVVGILGLGIVSNYRVHFDRADSELVFESLR